MKRQKYNKSLGNSPTKPLRVQEAGEQMRADRRTTGRLEVPAPHPVENPPVIKCVNV